MRTFEERYAAWLHGTLAPEEAAAFERELPVPSATELAQAETEAEPLGRLLRRAPAPPLGHGDFFNHQLLERIAAEERAKAPAPAHRGWRWPLAHLAWGGVCCLLAATVLYQGWVRPGITIPLAATSVPPVTAQPLVAAAGPLRDATAAARLPQTAPAPGVRATILEAHGGDPTVYASTVEADADGTAVVWLDGLEFLPANYPLQ